MIILLLYSVGWVWIHVELILISSQADEFFVAPMCCVFWSGIVFSSSLPLLPPQGKPGESRGTLPND